MVWLITTVLCLLLPVVVVGDLALQALMDPSMGPKIMKLRSAGILQMR